MNLSLIAALAASSAIAASATAAPPSAAAPPTKRVFVRTNAPDITTLPGFPLAHFRMNISPKLYRSLKISPVAAWVVVQLSPTPHGEMKIIRSDAGGTYDKLALAFAEGWRAVGYNTTERRTQRPALQSHLLIYQIADGLMAVNFSYDAEPFYAGPQRTDVWIGVHKNGKWSRIGGTKWNREFPRIEG